MLIEQLRRPVRPGPQTRTVPRLAADLFRLVRPGQWPKNLLVVSVPLVDLGVWRWTTVWGVVWAVVAFTLASTLVYVLNDALDRERDRAHPVKRHRPIAAGRLSMPAVVAYASVLSGLLVVVLSVQPWSWAWPIGVYLLLNLGYSLGLKNVPLLDVFLVASGFVLRVIQGYVAADFPPSGWLLICVLSLSLLLAVSKRRQELTATDTSHRPALLGYTVPFTEQLMVLSAVLAASSYLLYLRTEVPFVSTGSAAVALLAPLALFGLFRYLQLIAVRGGGGDPTRTLLRDPPLVVNAALWMVLSIGIQLAPQDLLW
jgi:4-hydroxybenzoate polyprenyltransferase